MDSNEADSPPSPTNAESDSRPPPLEPIGFTFSGDTGEYFRIWIVNLLLSVVTLGLYWPWAMVRTRRYLYANTQLGGHSFDYLAKPKNLLIGYLIVMVFFAIYILAGIFNPLFVYPVVIVYGLAAPWMIYKAFRFRARNTAYRNVRFKFSGHLNDSYVTYLAWAILVPFTFGLIIPYWEMKKKEYFFDNLQFGKTFFNFNPKATEYYKYYLLFFAFGMVLYFVLIFIVIAGAAVVGATADTIPAPEWLSEEAGSALLIAGAVLGYLILIVIGVVFQKGLWVLIFNYNVSVWNLGPFGFQSNMKFGKFVSIAVVNLIASVASLGLLIPWAKIRMTRYKLENFCLLAPGGEMGTHFEADIEEEGALGEAATEFMDFEVGL